MATLWRVRSELFSSHRVFFALKPAKNLYLTPSIRLDRTISIASHLRRLLLFLRLSALSQCLASKTVCLPNPKLQLWKSPVAKPVHLVHAAQKLSSFFQTYWASFFYGFVLVREELSAYMAWSPGATACLLRRRHHCHHCHHPLGSSLC